MSLYTAKQVNISICWFSKELKPNEWIQWVEAAIIGKNVNQSLLAEATIVEKGEMISTKLLSM